MQRRVACILPYRQHTHVSAVNDRASRSVDGIYVLHRAAFSFQYSACDNTCASGSIIKCQPLALCSGTVQVGDDFFPSNCCTLQVCIHRRIHFSFVLPPRWGPRGLPLQLVLGEKQTRLLWKSTCCSALHSVWGPRPTRHAPRRSSHLLPVIRFSIVPTSRR